MIGCRFPNRFARVTLDMSPPLTADLIADRSVVAESPERSVAQRVVGITGEQFDDMAAAGAFDRLAAGKIELIEGNIRVMSPAGPIHDDHIDFIQEWSHASRTPDEFRIRVQCGIACDDDRPEPDIAWLSPGRYLDRRPAASDVHLLIEVADSSLADDLQLKADLYAAAGIREYWIVDVPNRRIHVLAKPKDGTFTDIRIVPRGGAVSPMCKPEATLDTGELFVAPER